VKQLGSKSARSIAAATFCVFSAFAIAAAGSATAGDANKSDDDISIELNKLESTDKGCRAVLVVNNHSDSKYTAMKLDLVMFEGGVFTRRVALDLAPIRADKRSVKLFELDGLSCDKISEFLINDVMECKTASGSSDGCLKRISVSSLTKTKLSK